MLLMGSFIQIAQQIKEHYKLDDPYDKFRLCYCDTDSLYIDTHKLFLRDFFAKPDFVHKYDLVYQGIMNKDFIPIIMSDKRKELVR